MAKRIVFLDRDGVINRNAPEGEYIIRNEQMILLPGAAQAVKRLNELGFAVIVVTNQRCVSMGQISEKGVDSLHEYMLGLLSAEGARIDDIFYCPHSLEDKCFCRKPQPGMLLAGLQKFKAEAADCFMVGDSYRDIKAGRLLGVPTILVGWKPGDDPLHSQWQAADLAGAVDIIERESGVKSK